MCCKHCCNVEPIEVGTIVHEMNIFRGTVRTNGALTITVEYLGPEVAVISYSSKGRGNFHSEASGKSLMWPWTFSSALPSTLISISATSR